MFMKGEIAASATWEDEATFRERHLAFQLEDDPGLEGERDIMWMWGCSYTRHRHARDIRRAAECTQKQHAHAHAQAEPPSG